MSKKVKENHLSLGHMIIWKSSEISAAVINLIVLGYLTFYASNIMGLNTALVGTLLMASKIFDAFTDLIAGWLVDNTNTKLGKGRPYELCIIGQTICTVLLFSGSSQWSMFIKCAWIVFMYSLLSSVFATLRNAAQNVYMIRHFNNNRELISKQAAYGSIFVMLFSIIVSAVFPVAMGKLATSASGWRSLILIFMIPATLIGVLRFIFCKENTSPEDKNSEKNKVGIKEMLALFKSNKYVWILALIMLAYNIMTNLSVASFYFTYIVGDISLQSMMSITSIVVLPAMLFIPTLVKKVGSVGKLVFYMSWVGIIGYIILFFSKAWLPGILVGSMLGTIGTLPVMYYGGVFIMDICTYNEMKGLPRMEGTSSALSNFTAKVGSAMGSFITGILLLIGGYISTVEGQVVEQPNSAIMMIRICYSIVPLLCTLLIGYACKKFSSLDKDIEEYENRNKIAVENSNE